MKTPQQLLQQTLEVGECLLPDASPSGRTPYPTVFVHGLLGWGARDALYRAVPYWGLAAGDVLGYLNACGYDCRAASVGIISSAWDRACELYAELTGGTADYGIAHAQRFGHARFGTAYPNPLVPDWGADRPIDLVGHSFGGATARLLAQLLAHGCPEEVQAAEAAGETPSPLFTGGKTGWVHALVAIAAPHDGSTFLDVQPDAANALSTLFLGAARALGISAFKDVYDFRLDQFGIRRDPDEPITTAALRMLAQNPLPAGDSAFDDLRCAGARALNARIDTLPDAWYFSIPCCRTLPRLLTHDQKPDTAMTPLLWPFSTAMGRAGGAVPSDWLPNDGLVNTVSALYPTDSAGRCLTKSGQTGYIQQDGYSNVSYQPGVWNVMPVRHYDHGNFIAGMPVPDLASQSVTALRQFYLSLMDNLSHVSAASGLPFTDVAADRWSYTYIKQMYDAGVVSGMTPTTFEPAGDVTRAQFVTMLAGLAKADVSKYPATSFRDVPEGAWYAPYVNWALANGIVSGTSATTFSPDAKITRQDMAVMLYQYTQRYDVALQQQTVTPFMDESSISAYALPAVQALHRAGVISGMPDGSFQPLGTATREQACVVLCTL